jgi:kinesin family protein 6/9
VPFRQSKLTHVLKDTLGGNCKTTMIANIWGEAAQLEETISVRWSACTHVSCIRIFVYACVHFYLRVYGLGRGFRV